MGKEKSTNRLQGMSWAQMDETRFEPKGRELQIIVGAMENVLAWCRKCSGHARFRFGAKLLSQRQLAADFFRKIIIDIIKKLEDGKVSCG